ncbi:ribonuclease HI [Candidatus Chloroploca sp. Khr17]|uniref:ribonuclease HI n=1 Tax=Candidatus Chloroploca sp. Khr17 TaxID=2496869 RepID=UPI00196A9872|nr:ribonuclease HI [Candidatus Chloroploca sp. Khr17]
MSKKHFYAVVVGRMPGIYTAWAGANGAEAQVKGFPSAIFKGFATHAEAKRWYEQQAERVRHRTAAAELARGERAAPPGVEVSLRTVEKSEAGEETAPHESMPERDAVGTGVSVGASVSNPSLHEEALAQGKVVLYTDGGCHGNPGKGSYGVVLLYKNHRKEFSAGYAFTTSNRMEIMACIVGLKALQKPSPVVLFSDSAYVINTMTKGWAKRWRANGWHRKVEGELVPARNADLWQVMLDLCAYHEVKFVKVRGHAGIPENERCHELASLAMAQGDLLIDHGFVEE